MSDFKDQIATTFINTNTPRDTTPQRSDITNSENSKSAEIQKEETEGNATSGKAKNAMKFFQNLATNIQSKIQENIVDKF